MHFIPRINSNIILSKIILNLNKFTKIITKIIINNMGKHKNMKLDPAMLKGEAHNPHINIVAYFYIKAIKRYF